MRTVSVFCWHCGKKFDTEPKNDWAGQIFCSDKCRIDDFEFMKKELEDFKKGGEKNE